MLEIRHDRMTNTAAILEAYNQLYSAKGILHRDSFYLWLIDQLAPQRGRLLLDISCGEGRLVNLAHQQGLQAYGIDFSVVGLRKAQTTTPFAWMVGDGEQLPLPDQCVDYVTHIGSLEHYIEPARGAAEIARVLKPDGRACILLPNAFGIWGNIKHVWQYGEIFDDGQPLQRYATRQTWMTLLESSGLRILRTIGYGELEFPRTSRDAIWMLSRPQKLLRYLLIHVIPTNLANHFVFICTRA